MATTTNPMCRLESIVNKALKNVVGIDGSRLDCERPLLNIAKKKIGCDMMVASFARRFVVSSSTEVDKATQEKICKELLECTEIKTFVERCNITSPAGHLTFYLNRSLVVKEVLSNILTEREDYGRQENPAPISVLLNDTVLSNSGANKHHENLSLDQLRTALLVDHVRELLRWAGASILLMRSKNSSSETSVCEHIKTKQELLSAFGTSLPDINLEEAKFVETRGEISVAMNDCKYLSHTSLKERECLEETCSSCQTVSRNCNDKDAAKGKNSVCSVDVGRYLLDNEDLIGACNKNLQRSTVSITEEILNHVTCLETIARNVSPKEALLTLHVLPCRLQFRYQQEGFIWQMLSPTSVAQNQAYLCHGPVISLSKSQQSPQHAHMHVKDLLEIRENQLKEAFILKYGDIVEGTGWHNSIRTMATSTLKLEILSTSTSSTVKINLSESAQEFRQATFVMYNCARLAKLFQKYEQNVCKGIYSALPHVTSVDFSLLRDEAEWRLFLHYIFNFPSVVQEATRSIRGKPSEIAVQLQTHKISCFLFDLSHEFSSYYGRVHVLVEPREHLFPTMFARLYLMKAVQQVIHNCLGLLNIKPLMQM